MRFVLLFTICIPVLLLSQVRCDYQPIDFGDVTPVWNRVIIDSSMIGYSYSNELRSDFIRDGMEHIARQNEGHSFIEGEYLYSIQTVLIAGDIVGYYIEQIDLETGQGLWSTSIDTRNRDYMYKIYDAWVQDSLLIVKGGRRVTQFATTFANLLGSAPLYPMIQTFDINDGALVEEYVADSSVVDQPLIMTTAKSLRYYEITTPQKWEIIRYRILKEDALALVLRSESDSAGNATIIEDTLLVGGDVQSDWLNDTSAVYLNDPIEYRETDSTYVFVQQRARRFEGLGPPSAATVTIFDYEWNTMRKLDLSDLLPANFGSVDVMSYTEDRIVLRCCANFNPNQTCENWFVLLDDELNVLRLVDATRSFNSAIQFPIITEEDDFYFAALNRDSNENFQVGVFKSDSPSSVRSVLTGHFVDDGVFERRINQGSTFILPDGDLLFLVHQGCLFEPNGMSGAKSTFPEWFRIDASDLALPVSTGEVTRSIDGRVYPNPVVDFVNVDFGDYVTGMTSLYDSNGALLDQRYLDDVSMVTYDMSAYPTGIYQVQVVGEGGRVWTERLVKVQ